jgi:hypothetical protein
MEYLDHCAAFTNRDSEETEYSIEGNLLHGLMDEIVQQVICGNYQTAVEQVADWVLPNNGLTDEQATWLRFCCHRIDELFAAGGRPTAVYTEINVEVKTPEGAQLNHGFLDAVFIYANGSANLVDYKFGWIPVPDAQDNLQGQNYMVGCFQLFPEVKEIWVEFLQPKLNRRTSAVFMRDEIQSVYDRLEKTIEEAKYVQTNPPDVQKFMSPGAYCEYCGLKDSCAVLANHRAEAGARMSQLPVPKSFDGMVLRTPEEWALARYWCEVVETGIVELKSKAKEVAELNGGELRCTLPNGEVVVYEMKERNTDRVLGSAPEVAEALKEIVTLEQILGAADLALGKLLTIATNAMVELAAVQGKKLTKKAAKEEIESTLSAFGVLSKPETKIRYLKLRKQTKTELAEAAEQKTISI